MIYLNALIVFSIVYLILGFIISAIVYRYSDVGGYFALLVFFAWLLIILFMPFIWLWRKSAGLE